MKETVTGTGGICKGTEGCTIVKVVPGIATSGLDRTGRWASMYACTRVRICDVMCAVSLAVSKKRDIGEQEDGVRWYKVARGRKWEMMQRTRRRERGSLFSYKHFVARNRHTRLLLLPPLPLLLLLLLLHPWK